MLFPKDSLEFIYLDAYSSQTLSGTTLQVSVDGGEWADWDWVGESAAEVFKDDSGVRVEGFLRTGRKLFAGPDVDNPGDAIQFALGVHVFRWRTTGLDEQRPTRPTTAQVEVG